MCTRPHYTRALTALTTVRGLTSACPLLSVTLSTAGAVTTERCDRSLTSIGGFQSNLKLEGCENSQRAKVTALPTISVRFLFFSASVTSGFDQGAKTRVKACTASST